MALKNNKEENFISEILLSLSHLKMKNIGVSFEWIPSHCGIMGNERADFHAKAALNKPIEITNHLCTSEVNSILKMISFNQWQSRWQNSPNTHYKVIQKSVSKTPACSLERARYRTE